MVKALSSVCGDLPSEFWFPVWGPTSSSGHSLDRRGLPTGLRSRPWRPLWNNHIRTWLVVGKIINVYNSVNIVFEILEYAAFSYISLYRFPPQYLPKSPVALGRFKIVTEEMQRKKKEKVKHQLLDRILGFFSQIILKTRLCKTGKML